MLSKLLSAITPGQSEKQEARQIEGHSLYHFNGCGFCFRVLIAMKQLGIDMEKRNIHQSSDFMNELRSGGGKTTVPCLRIEKDGEIEWMYESADIIQYLRDNFSKTEN